MTTTDSPLQVSAREGVAAPDAHASAVSDRWNSWIALLVGVATMTVFWITLAPDVSFWDSGEFIATSWSLGIPHPPGTPLYVLIGRVFALLFHSALHLVSVAQAVNLLSAIPSAVAAVFLYLCVVRIGKKIWNDSSPGFSLPAAIAGLTAALFAAFASTLWVNSIEAEVYAVSGMWAVFAAWLVLVWADSEPKDERLLVVCAYLLALNIGVHLATYLAALAILPFAFLYERRLAIPVSFLAVLAMAKDLQFFLLVVALLVLPTLQFGLLPAEYARRNRQALLTSHALAFMLSLWGALQMSATPFRNFLVVGAPVLAFAVPWTVLAPPKKRENPLTDLGFLLALVTVLGFSCHLFLPIRSALHPAINEAQPDNWKAFWDVILRSQYKPGSVLERQASWVFQFDNMFWRYFREQWKPEILAWALGVPGIFVHLRRHPRSFVLIGLLFIWTSFMLVLKMNFTEHEVRDRDYFFSSGFFYYATWMGMGLGWLVDLAVRGARGSGRVALAASAAVLAILVAVLPVRGHWRSHDRRGNWVAYDYAYNMLVALEPNSVIFTNGDNDTFPLWYLQEVVGFRKDVRIVNLSLLNTPWYATQLRDEEPKVPMTRTKDQLWQLRPIQDAKTGKIHWIKDIVTNDIINTNYERGDLRPIYFAVTVDDLMDLEKYLELQGLVFKFDPSLPTRAATAEPAQGDLPPARGDILTQVDLVTTRRNLEELYKYRGLLRADGKRDMTVHRDENDEKLCTNYGAAWARMAIVYRQKGDMSQAADCMIRATEMAPDYDPISSTLGVFLIDAKRYDEADRHFRERVAQRPKELDGYLGLAYLAQVGNRYEEALDWYMQALQVDPSSPDVLAGLFQSYYQLGRLEEAENVLQRWIERNPSDKSARERLAQMRQERLAAESTRVKSSG